MSGVDLKTRELRSRPYASDSSLLDVSSKWPQVAFVVPRLDQHTSEHFAAIPKLLERISRSVRVVLIAEKGSGIRNLPGIARMEVVGEHGALSRIVRTLRLLEQCRAEGIRTYFVRVSRVAALITGLWCRIRGGRLFYWHSGAITYRPTKSIAELKDWLWSGLPVRMAFGLCHRLVTGPQSMVAHYVREFGVPERKIVVLPNDVDIERFRVASRDEKLALRARLGINAERIIIMVHRLSPVRRLPQYLGPLLPVLALNPGWVLVIVGDGPERRTLEHMVAASNTFVDVRLLGTKAHSEIPNYLRAADVFLNPSYVEGFPRVVIEAMACGLPMVVTDAGGTRDLLPGSLHTWVTPRDQPGVFAATLTKLLRSDESQLAEIRNELLIHSRRYSTEVVAGEYLRALFAEGSDSG